VTVRLRISMPDTQRVKQKARFTFWFVLGLACVLLTVLAALSPPWRS